MKQIFLEIVRQKWRFLTVIAILVLLNVVMAVLLSAYQLPQLAGLQTKWSDMRSQAARTGQVDSATLQQQGAADLEKLKARIPAKREYARVLSDLIEAAASNAVEVGAVSYKPLRIKEEALLSYQLTFSVKGGYAAVKSYLSDIQKNQEMIVVDAVTFSNSDLFVENVVMNLTLTVYLREGA